MWAVLLLPFERGKNNSRVVMPWNSEISEFVPNLSSSRTIILNQPQKEVEYRNLMPTNCQAATVFTLSLFLLFGAGAAFPTAYEVIQAYGFPVGIIPKGMTHYDLDSATGRFNGYLNGTCSFSLEGSYQLRYNSRISGYIYENKLTNLSGVSVKVLFFWLNIVEVRRYGDNLEFSVGITSAEFSIDNFFVSPQCGCGFDCDGVDGNREKWNPRSSLLVYDI